MNRFAILFALAGTLSAAQTPTTPAPKAATSAAKPAARAATGVRHTATATLGSSCRPTSVIGVKLPAGVPPVKAVMKAAFTLCYEDIKIGTGAEAEPNKLYKVNYTGWLVADGRKFDSSFDHRAPVMDKDGKPQKDADGKPVLGEAQPFSFPQGMGRLIPGWDQGFEGMKIGGKRRLFIPWELAYGVRGIPTRDAEHPGIPPKSDLIFDIELLDITDLPARPAPGAAGMRPMPGRPQPGAAPGTNPSAAPGATPSATPGSPAATAKPAAPASPAAPSAPTTPAPATPAPTPAPTEKPANPAPPQ